MLHLPQFQTTLLPGRGDRCEGCWEYTIDQEGLRSHASCLLGPAVILMTTSSPQWVVPLLVGLSFIAAPAPGRGQTATAPAKSSSTSIVSILARRSNFFPDLAHSGEPLDTKGKFKLFVLKSVSPATFLGSSFAAGMGQAGDYPSGYGQGGAAYGERLGADLATRASANFFGTFLLASALHQDPRFFVTSNAGLGQNLRYVARQTFATRKDDGGKAFNWSGLLGPLFAQSLANAYLPSQERNAGNTCRRYGISLASGFAVNVLKQYWPTIFKRLRIQK